MCVSCGRSSRSWGPVSVFAARASMAAERQGRYLPFHRALMREPKLTGEKVIEIAGRTGLDMERLRQDMKDPAIGAYLDETQALARQLGIGGTPAFVVGDTLVPGIVDTRAHEGTRCSGMRSGRA